jgi:DNA polymerase-3 subunit delta'
MVERSGAALDVDEARSIVARAQRRPLESARQVLMITDLHLAERAVPALLKTVEEPPPATVFVLIADDLPSILTTIASRCVQVAFDPVSEDAVVGWLTGRGVAPDQAESVARAAGGRLDRAALLVNDPGYRARQEQWRSVPARLDGSGAAAAVMAAELLASADEALEPLRGRHAEELASLTEQAELTGARGISGRRQVEERHKREERRWRTDDLRFGLATLAEVYRDRLSATVAVGEEFSSTGRAAESRRVARQVEAIGEASVALGRNANESLMMEALMVELSGMIG